MKLASICLFLICSLLPAALYAQESEPSAPSSEAQHESSGSPKCAYFECAELIPLEDDIYYTVTEPHTLKIQAGYWGLKLKEILPLNPDLNATDMLEPGQKILVHSRMPSAPVPLSIGKPNKGSLKYARIMPEGEGYRLRSFRQRAWGSDVAIQALTTAFKTFHDKYPDAPLINVGEISKSSGGPLKPHLSHQSGRDADIGFVFNEEPNSHHPEHFTDAKPSNFDAEKSWFFIESLLKTGLVKAIYVDESVQKMLYKFAAPKLTQEQKEAIFPYEGHRAHAIFQHWPGHKNHFHIRFICPADQPRCKNKT